MNTMATDRLHRRIAVALCMASVLAIAVAGAASAGTREHGPWTNDFEDHACDAGYVVAGHEDGHSRLLEPTPANPEFFRFQTWYGGHTTVTNPANGKSISEEWSGDYREHSIDRQPVGGYVYRYQSTDQATYRIRDSRGRVIYEEHGRIVASYLFDTVGDGSFGQSGGTYLEDPVELENTWDPTFDFCAFVDDRIG
jgi:hypothetical protein